jgi:tRNA-Thr(GGU) m(6)t(6)A37 methyltransferase TsaA
MSKCPLVEIGRVHSPYIEQSGTPIQPAFGEAQEAEVHVHPQFREGLEDLQGFSHIWLLSWLDRSDSYKLKVIPYRDTIERGLFATRAPRRPNPIGISPVKLISVDLENGIIHVRGIDLLDGTPIIDIKPYSHKFDSYPKTSSGWLEESIEKHTADNRFDGNA